MTEHDEVGQAGRSFRGQFMDVMHESSDVFNANKPNRAEEKMSQIINSKPEVESTAPETAESKAKSDFIKESYKRSEEKFASIFMPKEEVVEEAAPEGDDPAPETPESAPVAEDAPAVEETVVEEAIEPIEQPIELPVEQPVEPSAAPVDPEPEPEPELIETTEPVEVPEPLQTPFLDNVAVDKRPLSTPTESGMDFDINEAFIEPDAESAPEPAADPTLDETLDSRAAAIQNIQNDILSETAILNAPGGAPQPAAVDRLNRDNAEGKPGMNQEVNMRAAIENSMTTPSTEIPSAKIYENGKPVDVAVVDAETAALKPVKKKRSALKTVILLLFLMAAGCAVGAWIWSYHREWLSWLDSLGF
ncbi:hypothetical protein FWF74_00485 [Candidatus Saccharibacteria bacterium]|nr:hypothetical protein [Candidatus Saccharibacteria bacterium]MCL1963324.1 hypothetical protein [Candidatus Saccharibacteria bacterium]